jgi:XTP/dITP diphosphohydrolase
VERLTAQLASGNRHKLDELRAALEGWELGLLDAGPLPPEDGDSYFENARAKARFGRAHGAPDAWAIGEDSGIEVDGVGGEPGVRSARWHGDADPVAALLERLAFVVADGRRARYVCELVAVSPEGEELRGTGVLEGRIALTASGNEGFGYDPIFVPRGEERTVAELGNDWKRGHSHRARAARALRRAVEALHETAKPPP